MDTLREIVRSFNITDSSSVTLLRESSDNCVYVVGEGDKKILRVSKRLPISDIQFEYEAMDYLNTHSFKVPMWLKSASGDNFVTSDDGAVAVMFAFVDGYHVSADSENFPSPTHAYTAGKALGQLSAIGKGFTSVTPRGRTVFTELERVIQYEKEFRENFVGGDTFVDEVKNAIAFAKNSTTEYGLIHNDFRYGNVFFKNENEISGVIDFDWSCIGPTIKDLALGVLEWSTPDGRKEPNFDIFDAFLEGYNASNGGKKYERNAELYSWIQFSALSDTATYFCDRLQDPALKKDIQYSYMYKKYLFFLKL